jgi:hypothetical protein
MMLVGKSCSDIKMYEALKNSGEKSKVWVGKVYVAHGKPMIDFDR